MGWLDLAADGGGPQRLEPEAYSRRARDSKQIYIMAVNNPGGVAQQLTSLPGESGNLSWVRKP